MYIVHITCVAQKIQKMSESPGTAPMVAKLGFINSKNRQITKKNDSWNPSKKSPILCPLSSVFSPQSSVLNHCSSILSPQSSIHNPQSLILNLQSLTLIPRSSNLVQVLKPKNQKTVVVLFQKKTWFIAHVAKISTLRTNYWGQATSCATLHLKMKKSYSHVNLYIELVCWRMAKLALLVAFSLLVLLAFACGELLHGPLVPAGVGPILKHLETRSPNSGMQSCSYFGPGWLLYTKPSQREVTNYVVGESINPWATKGSTGDASTSKNGQFIHALDTGRSIPWTANKHRQKQKWWAKNNQGIHI